MQRLTASRFVALVVLIVTFKRDCGCSTLLPVTNLRMENEDMTVTVLWDPLQSDENVLYTLFVNGESTYGCTSIEGQSCEYDFEDDSSVHKAKVEATVDGVLKGRSEEERFYYYDLPVKISPPRVTITRSATNVTAYFKFPTLALENETETTFEAEFTCFYANESLGLEKLIKQISTTEKCVSFATSVLNNATICVNAKIKVALLMDDHFSNITRACIEGIPTNNILPSSSTQRLTVLLGVAVGVGAVFLILLILLCRRVFKSKLTQTHPELPKYTALIIAMSNGPEEKDVATGTSEGEEICKIYEENTKASSSSSSQINFSH